LLSSFRGDRRSSSLSMIYCSIYRRHFRMPILLSLAAILLNLPAFFEIQSHVCRRRDGRYGYGLDVIEVTIGYRSWVQIFIYGADLSNFLVILNSATNCLIFLRGPSWLQRQIVQRTTIRKQKLAFNNLQTSRRIALLQNSWISVQTMTSGQFGVNVLHALLRKDPSLIDALRPIEQGGDLDDEEEPLRQTAGGPIQRKSFDLLTYPQYYQAGERIVTLFDDLMQMMQNQHAEQVRQYQLLASKWFR
uniref:G_PROTEIN_RECEP_F1_2 domain-containing protein n=1 Tax=Anisakis simplex TaxID=6269 RepID=A0A0M3KA95_ANISI